MLKIIIHNKMVFIFWFLGCVNIVQSGFHQSTYRGLRDPSVSISYPLDAVIFTCSLFSIYFIVFLSCIVSTLRDKHPLLSYSICLCISLGQIGLAILGAMHAPPYWGAYIINVFLIFLFQLLSVFTLFKSQKKE